jgi:archaellum component FlaC
MLETRQDNDLRGELEACEKTIERGLNTFIEVGIAIRQIRDNRLYRADYDTFEEYCRERWGWSRRHANRQVEAADTVELLKPESELNGLGPVGPVSERQARAIAPLAKEDPGEAREVMNRLREQHGDEMTAKHTEQVVKEIKTAKAIRTQLPESVRAVVENSEPEDHSLSRNPVQLRHLLDVHLKHGEGRAGELALRVADGEFQSTFEAYDAIREERGESRSEPKKPPDALEKWNSAMYDIELRLNSVRDMGGIKAIPSAWLPEKKEVLRERLLRMSRTLNELAEQIGGDDE